MRCGFVPVVLGGLLLWSAGCATPGVPYHGYFQRARIRGAIMPSNNTTEYPDAPVIFNQACEAALRQRGFLFEDRAQ